MSQGCAGEGKHQGSGRHRREQTPSGTWPGVPLSSFCKLENQEDSRGNSASAQRHGGKRSPGCDVQAELKGLETKGGGEAVVGPGVRRLVNQEPRGREEADASLQHGRVLAVPPPAPGQALSRPDAAAHIGQRGCLLISRSSLTDIPRNAGLVSSGHLMLCSVMSLSLFI